MRIPNARYTDPAILAAELRTTFSAPLLGLTERVDTRTR